MEGLVQQARRGNREAFERLAALVIDRMYALAYRITRDHGLAEDAVQVALVRVWRDLPALRDPERFEAWLRRIVVHSCLTEARRHRASLRLPRVVIETASADASGDTADRDQLERALAELPIDQRAVVALHFYLGLQLVEIADALGIAPGTARSRLHYALRGLRAAIESGERAGMPAGRTA